jgi:formylglycine-generating enzyme required for sulfatase activity
MKKCLMVGLLSFLGNFILAQEMVYIPSGSFIMGTHDNIISSSGLTDMLPNSVYTPHHVILDSFRISKYEIESSLFYEFLHETGRSIYDQSDIYSSLLAYNGIHYSGYPAVTSYLYALDFCKWLSKKHDTHYRLPTEAEWEYVATGGDGRKYPWGNQYQSFNTVDNTSQRIPLASYSDDRSPFGVMNMFGNVAEWVLDYFNSDWYQESPQVNPICVDGEQLSSDKYNNFPPTYIVRGKNNYDYNLDMIDIPVDMFATIKRRFPYWHKYFLRSSNESIGFRIVEDKVDKLFTTGHL